MTVIDWGALMNEAATASAALPAGDYDMIIVDAQYKAASTGRPMYIVKFKVETGPHAGRGVKNNFVVTVDNATALRIFFRQMTALGLDANFFASNPAPELVAQSLINRRALVTLSVRKYRGEDTNDVDNVAAPRAAAGAPLGGQAPAAPPLGMQPQQFAQPMAQQFQQPMAQQFQQPMAPQPMMPQQPMAPQPIPQPAAAAPAPVPQPQFQPPQPAVYDPGAQQAPPPPPPQPMAPPQPDGQQQFQQPQQLQVPPGYVQMPDGSIVPVQQQQQPQPQPQPVPPQAADPNAPPPLPY